MPARIPSWLVALALSGHPGFASGPESAPAPPSAPWSLEALVARALKENPEVAEGRWRVRGAEARLDEARASGLLPRLRLESASGLVPDAEGDVFNPPVDTTGLRSLGVFNRTELQFVQPLYTFGYLRSLREAAAAGVEVEESSLAGVQLDVALQVKEFYYGLLAARDLAALAERLGEELRRHRAEVSPDDPSIPLSAPYKLELALLELERGRREAVDRAALARRALAWTAGIPEDAPLELEQEWIEPTPSEVPPRDSLFVLAFRKRPDWRRLRAGIAARQAVQEATSRAYLPQLFLTGGVRYAVAPNRTDQHNPFVKDEFNYFNGGIFLGLRQSFEWGLLGAEAARAQADLYQLRAKETGAVQGIRLEIEQAFGDWERARDGLESAREGRRTARRWLRAARDEYELDPGQVKELVSAFEAFAGTEQGYYGAVYDFNMAVARLERTVGMTSSFE
jgi:outer membrane protein TolC